MSDLFDTECDIFRSHHATQVVSQVEFSIDGTPLSSVLINVELICVHTDASAHTLLDECIRH